MAREAPLVFEESPEAGPCGGCERNNAALLYGLLGDTIYAWSIDPQKGKTIWKPFKKYQKIIYQ